VPRRSVCGSDEAEQLAARQVVMDPWNPMRLFTTRIAGDSALGDEMMPKTSNQSSLLKK